MINPEDIIVDKYNINDDDTVIIHVPVDKLKPQEAQNYLSGVLNAFRKELDSKGKENAKLFVFPHHPGKDRPSLQVVAPPAPNSTMVFNVPIGHIPKQHAPAYLKAVKQQLLSEGFKEKYPDCKLIVLGVFDDGKRIEIEVK